MAIKKTKYKVIISLINIAEIKNNTSSYEAVMYQLIHKNNKIKIKK